jgi:hypothetical protein
MIHLKRTHFPIWPKIKAINEDLSGTFTFNSSCFYENENSDSSDLNKLVGIKRDFFNPHNESVMITWRPIWEGLDKGKIELFSYYHFSQLGEFKNQLTKVGTNTAYIGTRIGVIDIDTKYYFCINIQIDQYRIYVKGLGFTYELKQSNYTKGWLINPWFGGNNTAPKTMKIKVELY